MYSNIERTPVWKNLRFFRLLPESWRIPQQNNEFLQKLPIFFNEFGFELSLNQTKPQDLDMAFLVNVELFLTIVDYSKINFFENDAIWQRIIYMMRQIKEDNALHTIQIVLEFDADGAINPQTSLPIPAVFLVIDDPKEKYTAKRSIYLQLQNDIVKKYLPVLYGKEVNPLLQKTLDQLLTHLPEDSNVVHFGALLSRPIDALRVCIVNLNETTKILNYVSKLPIKFINKEKKLVAVEFTQFVNMSAMSQLERDAHIYPKYININVLPGFIYPYLGVEFHHDNDLADQLDQTWQSTFNILNEHQLANREDIQHAHQWCSEQQHVESYRTITHVKVVFKLSESPQAKIYAKATLNSNLFKKPNPQLHLEPASQLARPGHLKNKLLHQAFFEIAQQFPNHIAIECPDGSITYAALSGMAYHLAQQIQVTDNRLVAILLPHGWQQAVAVMAVLLKGGIYLPLEATWPAERIHEIMRHSNTTCLITSRELAIKNNLTSHTAEQTTEFIAFENYIHIKQTLPMPETLVFQQSEEDLAYIIYTSGSTGKPKGVMITHRSALNTVDDINQQFEVTQQDKFLAFSSLAFDLSVYDLFGSLSVGAVLVYPKKAGHINFNELAHEVQERKITVWNSVPAAMKLLVGYIQEQPNHANQNYHLRVILVSGDWIPVDLPKHVWQVFGHDVLLVSLGGATEGAIWSILHRMTGEDCTKATIPYGLYNSMRAQQIVVLNEQGELCKVGEPGELYIMGEGVAAGYWNAPDLTQQRFITLSSGTRAFKTGDLGSFDEQGVITFHGRKDFQAKIQGYRVDLSEIEEKIRKTIGSIQFSFNDVVVVAGQKNPTAEIELIVYLVAVKTIARQEISTIVQQIRPLLQALLPRYAVPEANNWLTITQLPLTANQKVDRTLLSHPDFIQQHYVAMSTAAHTPVYSLCTPEALRLLWQDVLGSSIAEDLSFFEQGGNSISIKQLADKIKLSFGVSLGIAKIYEQPYLTAMSRLIAKEQRIVFTQAKQNQIVAEIVIEPIIRIQTGTKGVFILFPPASGLSYPYLRLKDLADFTVYAINNPEFASDKTFNSVEEMVSRFQEKVDEICQQHTGKLILGGWSFGGILALAVAQQLSIQNKTVDAVILFDTGYPRHNIPKTDNDYDVAFEMMLESEPNTPDNFQPHIKRQYQVTEKLLETYSPPVYAGKVFLIKSQTNLDQYVARFSPALAQALLERHQLPALGWKNTLVDLTIFSIEGEHFKLFTENSSTLNALSQKLNTILNALSPVTTQLALTANQHALPVTSQQYRLWLEYLLDSETNKYNLPYCFHIRGELNTDKLSQAWLQITQQHIAFKTHFYNDNGEIKQIIDTDYILPLEVIDLTQSDSSQAELQAKQIIANKSNTVFRLEELPLAAGTLIKLADNNYYLTLVFHHIIVDGYSVNLLLKQLANYYQHETQQELNDSDLMHDYVVLEQAVSSGHYQQAEQFWRTAVADFPPMINFIPINESRADNNNQLKFALDSSWSEQLKTLAKTLNVTLFELLIGAFSVILHRYTGQEEMLLGYMSGKRSEEFKDLVSFLVNKLPLPVKLLDNTNFKTLVQTIHAHRIEARKNSFYPFQRIVQLMNRENIQAQNVINVDFSESNIGAHQFALSGLHVTSLETTLQHVMNDLGLVYDATGATIEFTCTYRNTLFSFNFIKQLVAHYQTLLQQIIANPDLNITTQPLLTAKESEQILVSWNDTATPLGNQTVVELFEAQVTKTPDHVALIFVDQHISYKELNERANTLAHHLINLGVKSNTLIAICLERSCEFIVAVLAVLKAGGAYVPLDPIYPAERMQFMLEDTKATVLITHSNLNSALQISNTILIDQFNNENLPVHNPHIINQPEDLIYIIYTSGTTGKPKGVKVTHANVVYYLHWFQHAFAINEKDIIDYSSSISFDVSVTCTLVPLTAGAAVVITSESLKKDAMLYLDHLAKHKVTMASIMSNYLSILAQQPKQVLSLKYMIVGGEELTADAAKAWLAKYPEHKLVNEYGPTETTVAATYFILDSTMVHHYKLRIPIGKPARNATLYVLDKHLQPVPVGVAGELYIGGAGVTQGYLNRPELTAERFIENPFATPDDKNKGINLRLYRTGDLVRFLPDGNIDYLGRHDQQVKIRGFRVELGEIENVLRMHPDVANVAITLYTTPSQQQQLIAYVVLKTDKQQTTQQQMLWQTLESALPYYMIPNQLLFIDALPLNVNGKLDSKALPKPQNDTEQAIIAPRSELERQLANIWSDILNISVDKLSITSNFFSLGGSSITANLLFNRIKTIRGSMEFMDIFRFPTIAGMAAIMMKRKREFLYKEAELAITIDKIVQPATNIAAYNKILLTGCTGFLGIYLLYELLNQTTAEIICLMREDNTISNPLERIMKSFQQYQLNLEAKQVARIHILVGDIAKPKLGLPDEEYKKLIIEIDVIYHNAASVNFLSDYATLREANVTATKQIIELAITAKIKPIHYISTMSVFSEKDLARSDKILDESSLPEYPEYLQGGYPETKWVAERLIYQLTLYNFPLTIYRPGLVTGDTNSGYFPNNQFTKLVLLSLMGMRAIPAINNETTVAFNPVDKVAMSIIRVSLSNHQQVIIHLNSNQIIKNTAIFDYLTREGYVNKAGSYAEWLGQLKYYTENSGHNFYSQLYHYLLAHQNNSYNLFEEVEDINKISSAKSLEMLAKLGIDFATQPEELLKKYVLAIAQELEELNRNNSLRSTSTSHTTAKSISPSTLTFARFFPSADTHTPIKQETRSNMQEVNRAQTLFFEQTRPSVEEELALQKGIEQSLQQAKQDESKIPEL